jgi:DnaK suppressor protein
MRFLPMERINNGTFEECLSCGQDINVKRLEVRPWAPYCITCQELIDSRKATSHLDIGG